MIDSTSGNCSGGKRWETVCGLSRAGIRRKSGPKGGQKEAKSSRKWSQRVAKTLVYLANCARLRVRVPADCSLGQPVRWPLVLVLVFVFVRTRSTSTRRSRRKGTFAAALRAPIHLEHTSMPEASVQPCPICAVCAAAI